MGDRYRPGPPGGNYRPQYDDYSRRAPSPDRGRRNDGYNFRGAAGSGGDRYRPQEQFTFQAPTGPSAPHFPAANPPPRDLPQRPRKKPEPRKNAPGGGKPFRGAQAGGFKKFRPKPAHQRDLLKRKDREPTPEQLHGMNGEGDHHYVEYISSDDDDAEKAAGEATDLDGRSRKRVKAGDTEEESARPQWSNPDPYSVLPPTDLGIGPKKDIVQTIRKAKVEAAAQTASSTNAIKENVDFISFDSGDESQEDEDQEDEDMDGGQFDPDAPPPPPPADLLMPTPEELMDTYGAGQQGKKRKRQLEQQGPEDIIFEWQPNGTNPTPWFRPDPDFTSNVGLQLHKEIIDFYDYVRPMKHEADIRNDIVYRIESALMGLDHKTKDVKIESFGSFASGLYLPTADMDLVALSRTFMRTGNKQLGTNKNEMWKVASHLRKHGMVRAGSIIVISKAKVPIVKFVDQMTGIRVDISFENDSGLSAVKTIENWKAQYPEMPVLVALIKQFLAMRDLHEVVNGGIGGLTIICLVVHMLQHLPQKQASGSDMRHSYGELLLYFLDLYGNKFNCAETGIFMEPPGTFSKTRDHVAAKINAKGLTIIDPNRADNDISGGSRNIGNVFAAFRRARNAIQKRLDQVSRSPHPSSSILECILSGNYTSFADQRATLDRLDRSLRRQDVPPHEPRPADNYRQQGFGPGPGLPTRAPPPAESYAAYGSQQDYQYGTNQQYPHPAGRPDTHALPPRPMTNTPGVHPPSSKKARNAAKNAAPPQPTDMANNSQKTKKTKKVKKASAAGNQDTASLNKQEKTKAHNKKKRERRKQMRASAPSTAAKPSH